MKRFLTVIISFILCFCLAGCSGEKILNDSTISVYSFNETVEFDDFSITALEIFQMEISEEDILKPKKGNAFVSVKFCIENISNEDVAISTLGMFKAFADGESVKISVTGSTAFTSAYDEVAVDGIVKSGEQRTGWFTVEIPEKWQELNIFISSSVLSNDYVGFKFENSI